MRPTHCTHCGFPREGCDHFRAKSARGCCGKCNHLGQAAQLQRLALCVCGEELNVINGNPVPTYFHDVSGSLWCDLPIEMGRTNA